jgi:hypothetical protein
MLASAADASGTVIDQPVCQLGRGNEAVVKQHQSGLQTDAVNSKGMLALRGAIAGRQVLCSVISEAVAI